MIVYTLLWALLCSLFLWCVLCFLYPKLSRSQRDLHPGKERVGAAHPGLTTDPVSRGPSFASQSQALINFTLTFTWTSVLNFFLLRSRTWRLPDTRNILDHAMSRPSHSTGVVQLYKDIIRLNRKIYYHVLAYAIKEVEKIHDLSSTSCRLGKTGSIV